MIVVGFCRYPCIAFLHIKTNNILSIERYAPRHRSPQKIRRVTHCNYKDNSIKVNAEFYSNENQEALPDFTNELLDEAELSTVTNTVRNNGRSGRAS